MSFPKYNGGHPSSFSNLPISCNVLQPKRLNVPNIKVEDVAGRKRPHSHNKGQVTVPVRQLTNQQLTSLLRNSPLAPSDNCTRVSSNCTSGSNGGSSSRFPPFSTGPKRALTTMAKRNARERNRVKQVNQGFQTLRHHIPEDYRVKKMSKVDTLRCALDYIRSLENILQDSDEELGSENTGGMDVEMDKGDKDGGRRNENTSSDRLDIEMGANNTTPSTVTVIPSVTPTISVSPSTTVSTSISFSSEDEEYLVQAFSSSTSSTPSEGFSHTSSLLDSSSNTENDDTMDKIKLRSGVRVVSSIKGSYIKNDLFGSNTPSLSSSSSSLSPHRIMLGTSLLQDSAGVGDSATAMNAFNDASNDENFDSVKLLVGEDTNKNEMNNCYSISTVVIPTCPLPIVFFEKVPTSSCPNVQQMSENEENCEDICLTE